MRSRHLRFGLMMVSVCVSGSNARAGLITFDDLTTRSSFYSLGIHNTYQGFAWGYSSTPGFANAVIPTTDLTGWASTIVSSPAISNPPTPVSGASYAWNANGPQSLFVDFRSAHDVHSGYFAMFTARPEDYPFNASTITMFGYDSLGQLIASSSTLSLTGQFRQLTAGFTNVRYLEIRADADSRWFSIDNLDVTPSSPSEVPEPSSALLLGLGALLTAARSLRRRKALHDAACGTRTS